MHGISQGQVRRTRAAIITGKRKAVGLGPDGPRINADGDKEWFVDGKRHRDDGPAFEYANGGKEWFVDGKQLTEAEFKKLSSSS